MDKTYITHICETLLPLEHYNSKLITHTSRSNGLREFLPPELEYVYNTIGYTQSIYDALHKLVTGKLSLFDINKPLAEIITNDKFLTITGWKDSITTMLDWYKDNIHCHEIDSSDILLILTKKKTMQFIGKKYDLSESRISQIIKGQKHNTCRPHIIPVINPIKIEFSIEKTRKIYTPWGCFNSINEAYRNRNIPISKNTLSRWCNSKGKITKQSYSNSEYLKTFTGIIGKSYKSLGFYISYS